MKMLLRRRIDGSHLSKIDFEDMWNSSKSIFEFVAKLKSERGIEINNRLASNTAHKLRKQGYNLKTMTNANNPASMKVSSYDEFIALWNNSESMKEFLLKTKYAPLSAPAIAVKLRRKGFNLKYMPRFITKEEFDLDKTIRAISGSKNYPQVVRRLKKSPAIVVRRIKRLREMGYHVYVGRNLRYVVEKPESEIS